MHTFTSGILQLPMTEYSLASQPIFLSSHQTGSLVTLGSWPLQSRMQITSKKLGDDSVFHEIMNYDRRRQRCFGEVPQRFFCYL